MKSHILLGFCMAALFAGSAFGGDYDPKPGAPGTTLTGQSSVKAFRSQSGCLVTQASNVRFEPVAVHPHVYGDKIDLILKETTEQDLADCLEGVKGTVTVEASTFDQDLKTVTKAWAFTSTGWEGLAEPEGYSNLYRVHLPGCCGSSDVDSYFSLVNGSFLFKSTVPILALSVPNSGIERYVALDDNNMADGDPGIPDNSDVIGILSYGSDESAPQRILIHGKKGDFYNASDLTLVIDGKPAKDKAIDLWKFDKAKSDTAITGISIRGGMSCQCDRSDLQIEVPIVNGQLRPDLAKASDPAVTFSAAASH